MRTFPLVAVVAISSFTLGTATASINSIIEDEFDGAALRLGNDWGVIGELYTHRTSKQDWFTWPT